MFYFESKNDIKSIIPILNSFMIYEEDSSQINEIFSAIVYLYSHYKLDKLIYPFAIIKRESPDFSILCLNKNESRGIEHTLSTINDYKVAVSELTKLPPGSKLELSYYSPFNKRTKDEIYDGLRLPSEDLMGRGYNGGRPEMEWAEIIKKVIHNKTAKLNKNHFEIFFANELLIEDDSPVETIIELEKGISYLEPHIIEYSESSYKKKFDKIHIITKNTFIYNVLSEKEIIKFSRDKIKL